MTSPQPAPRRPAVVTIVTLLQFLLGFLWLGITVYLLVISRSPETRQGSDPAVVIRGLEIAAAIIAPGAIFGLSAAYGLGKDKIWGWWLSLITNSVFVLMLLYSMIDDGWDNLDREMIGITLLSLVPVILLVLPSVREFYSRKPVAENAAPSASPSANL
jgi:CDP-diglyceride synthetase